MITFRHDKVARAIAEFAARVTGSRRGRAQLPFVVDLEAAPAKHKYQRALWRRR